MLDFWEEWPIIQEEWERRHAGQRDFLAAYLSVAPRFGHYVMPAPNQFVWGLDDVLFGKRDYDQKELITQDFQWKKWQRPSNWREISRDRWAMMKICEDVQGVLQHTVGMQYIFDPVLLEEVLISTPDVVNAVRGVAKDDFRQSSFRPLSKAVSAAFRTRYKEMYHARMESKEWSEFCRGAYSDDPWDIRWTACLRQLEHCSNLICQYMTRSFTTEPDRWSSSLLMHADLSSERAGLPGFKPFFKRPKMVPIRKDNQDGTT